MGGIRAMELLFPILAGICITLQVVFNTRVSGKIGFWETSVIVHATGLVLAVIFLLLWGGGGFKKVSEVNPLYYLGGCIGVIIIFSVMKSVTSYGPTFSLGVILVSQLIVATLIDTFGWFDTARVSMDFTKPLGIAVMILGIILFKLRG